MKFSHSKVPWNCIAKKIIETEFRVYFYILYKDQFSILNLAILKKLLFAYSENTLNGEISTKSMYISLNNYTYYNYF